MTIRLADMDAAIFDFNGTLSDDEGVLAAVFITMAAELGVPLTAEEYAASFLGRSDKEICAELLRRAGVAADQVPSRVPELLVELADSYNAAVAVEPAIGPGACALVRELHRLGKPLAVVTGASRVTVLPALTSVGLIGLFGAIVTEEDVRVGKPDPEGLFVAVRALSLPAGARVVVFEDSVPGLDAAQAAGMTAVGVRGSLNGAVVAGRGITLVDGLGPELLDLALA
ncbi:MAG: HAD family phosphatase [Microlunatus sp.]